MIINMILFVNTLIDDKIFRSMILVFIRQKQIIVFYLVAIITTVASFIYIGILLHNY
jgi:hypothetical protein